MRAQGGQQDLAVEVAAPYPLHVLPVILQVGFGVVVLRAVVGLATLLPLPRLLHVPEGLRRRPPAIEQVGVGGFEVSRTCCIDGGTNASAVTLTYLPAIATPSCSLVTAVVRLHRIEAPVARPVESLSGYCCIQASWIAASTWRR